MLEFGKSYVVTLATTVITPDGYSKWAIYGDYKGEHELSGCKYLQFGDLFLKQDQIHFIARSDNPNMGEIQKTHITHDGEVVRYKDMSFIGRAHVVKG